MLFVAQVWDGLWEYRYYIVEADSEDDVTERLTRSLDCNPAPRGEIDEYDVNAISLDANGVAEIGGGEYS